MMKSSTAEFPVGVKTTKDNIDSQDTTTEKDIRDLGRWGNEQHDKDDGNDHS